MKPLQLLTTNWHVPYLSLLAKIPQTVWWVVSFRRQMFRRDWDEHYRPLPPNVHHLALDSPAWLPRLSSAELDGVVLHSLTDLEAFQGLSLPTALVFHNSRHTEWRGMPEDAQQQRRQALETVLGQRGILPVFISPWKAGTWGFPGKVILPGIDTEHDFPGGYHGKEAKLLRVCSNFPQRDFMNGWTLNQQICSGIPNLLLGEGNADDGMRDPQGKPLTEARQSHSLDEYRDCLRRCRAMIVTNIPVFEDGWNLSMLEAMAQGMPIVSTYHPRCPLAHGHEGFMSDSTGQCREYAIQLLRDQALAQTMGARGREVVRQQFPLCAFLTAWSTVLWGMRGRP